MWGESGGIDVVFSGAFGVNFDGSVGFRVLSHGRSSTCGPASGFVVNFDGILGIRVLRHGRSCTCGPASGFVVNFDGIVGIRVLSHGRSCTCGPASAFGVNFDVIGGIRDATLKVLLDGGTVIGVVFRFDRSRFFGLALKGSRVVSECSHSNR